MSKMSKSQFKVGDVYDPSIANLEPHERRDTLESICYKTVERKYIKNLSPEEIVDKKDDLSEVTIQLNDLETEKKNMMADFKAKMELPTQKKKELLAQIKLGVEEREGQLFYIDDQENGMMYVFDSNAECIEARGLRQDERQTKIRELNGTNNEKSQ